MAIQRKLYLQHLVFERLQEYLKKSGRDRDNRTLGKQHYIRKGLQRWRRNYLRRCPALPPLPPLSSIRYNPKVMGTDSYYYRLRKRHFQDLIKQLKLQVRFSTAMAFARHFYRCRRMRRGIRQLLYYHQHRRTIAHHNNVIKGVIKATKRKSFHHWRRQIKLWYQYRKLSHVARVFHLRKRFQYFKKQLSYKMYAFQQWSKRVYYHHQTRRALSNLLILYYTRRKERKSLHKKALLYYKRKYFIRFLITLKRREMKRNQLHCMIRYYHGSKVIKQWKERTEIQITAMIRIRRSILRSSINKQLKYLYYWKEKINHQIQLRRRFYYYQQLKRFSYFSNINHSHGIMSPISSPSPTTTTSDTPLSISSTMYKVKLQQLRFYFNAWKIDYHGYQQKVAVCLKRFSWKYQIELSFLTFSHWQQVYERRACLRQRKKIAFQRWRKKSRKMRMWLDHWASLLLVDEGIHKLYPRIISSYFSSFPSHFSKDNMSSLTISNERASGRHRIKEAKEWKPFLSLSSEVLKEKIHDKLTSFTAFLWIYVEERFDRKQTFQRLRRFKVSFLNQLKIKAAITSTSSSIRLWKNLQSNLSSEGSSFSLTLPQMSLCRLVLHRWYERYLNKALYYQSTVPGIHKRLLTQLPQYPLIEQQINQRIPYHIKRRAFHRLHQIYLIRHERIISIQGRLHVRPLFYHWIRVYNYYAMKKLLQLPTPLDNVKAMAISPMQSTMIEDKEELAQHLAQLKKKIARSRVSDKKGSDNSVRAGSGKENRVISETNKVLNVSISSIPTTKRAPVKLIGNLSYTERYRSPIVEKKQSSSTNHHRDYSQERKVQRHELMKREPIQSNSSHLYDASESILDTTIATNDNYHLQLPSHSILTMNNSHHSQHTQTNAGELQNTTVLIHPSAAPRHYHNNHYTHHQHSLLNETIIEEDEEEENEEYSNDSLTENSSLTASYYHQKDNNNNHNSLNKTRIDYHYTYQQFIQERSYLGRYTRQSKK